MGYDSNNCWLGNYCMNRESGGCPTMPGRSPSQWRFWRWYQWHKTICRMWAKYVQFQALAVLTMVHHLALVSHALNLMSRCLKKWKIHSGAISLNLCVSFLACLQSTYSRWLIIFASNCFYDMTFECCFSLRRVTPLRCIATLVMTRRDAGTATTVSTRC